ncbi:LysR family transcriptional regulator [Pontibacillus salicampi]|uniref:LysR family transcriptional regulator n=1 Tax=Pontibacillus salicampi TaxID=1449801 RepID=A0ABV6LRQ2_9BACI
MELSWINTFVTVAEEGSFRKAADLLYVSQPTITVHVKSLEKNLGVTLFQRNNRNVKLTEEGRVYLTHAKQLLSTYQKGVEELQTYTQGYNTTLRLAISPLIADTVMPSVLKRFTKENPNVEISVHVMESEDIEKALTSEQVDIGFSCMESHNPDLQCQMLYEDEVVFVAPHDGMDMETAPAHDIEDLFSKHYLLSHNHPGYWNPLLQQLKTWYPGLRSMKVSQIHITKRFIENGLGISFLPKATVRRELMEGRLVEVNFGNVELPKANTYAITKYHHSLEREFLDFVTQYRYK